MSEENTAAKKPFFKSVSFKCIVVLLIIALVSGIFLTLCNALFEVTKTEEMERALSKLYDGGESVSYSDETIDSTIAIEDATINSVYKITTIDGEYVLDVTGAGGFSGGSVTCYIRVYVDSTAKTCEVKKISISSNEGQSYISKISTSDLDALVSQQSSSGFTAFSTDGIKTGATYSLSAISNATNAALTYVKAKYLGISDVVITVYDDFDYIEKIDTEATTQVVDGETVTYTIVTKKLAPAGAFTVVIVVDATETVVSYEITTNGSTAVGYVNQMYDVSKYVGMGADEILALLDVENNKVSSSDLKTGASYSNYLCAYAALFATANYQNSVELGTVENAVVDAEVNE